MKAHLWLSWALERAFWSLAFQDTARTPHIVHLDNDWPFFLSSFEIERASEQRIFSFFSFSASSSRSGHDNRFAINHRNASFVLEIIDQSFSSISPLDLSYLDEMKMISFRFWSARVRLRRPAHAENSMQSSLMLMELWLTPSIIMRSPGIKPWLITKFQRN